MKFLIGFIPLCMLGQSAYAPVPATAYSALSTVLNNKGNWTYASGAPAGACTTSLDWYLNTATNDIYDCVASAWHKAGTLPFGTSVPQTTTVNGHALSSNVTVTTTDLSLNNVTNDAQTKAAVVPNTAPSAGQLPVGNAGGTAYAPVTVSGDGTMASTGAITVTKTSGTAFGTSATMNTGTSGASVPLLNGANTWSALQSFTGGMSSGSSPPAVTAGTGGVAAGAEGTVPTVCAAVGVDCLYWDSTQHGPLLSRNNGSYLPLPQAPASTTVGHVVLFNATNGGLLSDGGAPSTVTTFSAGALSPLFTTSVATATTTPALTFALSNFAADSIFGNFTAGSAAASTQAIPSCANDGAHALVYAAHTLTCEAITTGGAGTVTAFSSGALSPLFTTSVATATSTPALSYSLSTAAAHAWLGNNTGSTAAPGYQTIGTGDLPGSGATTVNGQACTLGSTCAVTDATKVPTTTTVNGHALSGNVTVTTTDLSLNNVTNDAQTKAAIVPNTAPSAGQIHVGNAGGTAFAPVTVSGDGTMASTGAITITKLNGTSFAGTNGHLVSFGAANIPADSGVVAANAVVASSPGVGIAHFAGATQAATSSAVNLAGADVTGNLPVANLGSGTSASPSTFWRGDATWATPAGGSGGAVYFAACQGTVTSSATIGFINLGSNNSNCSGGINTSSGNMGGMITASCTLKNLRVASNSAGNVAGDGIVNVYLGNPNGAMSTTGITCTIGTGTTCNDTTHTASATAGQIIYLTVTGSSTSTVSYMSAGVACN